ncbi:protein of unknown function (DUF3529) [Rubidibacter lacunae KORDI 51-2]|uniref:Cofactor assembly of complex C subunit B n=1 Tax=Rubidibacter lacunae KORDI 51-2 TaxID=582515 RepID=U5DTS2_9CHRO|nr:cofactor assembly of complex C subunit B [Rubidibacter lacunae]ERN43070.1 protein of unknown function (DUF3529) [Rubidibacter lacunae KORDI 51-2]
MRALEFGNALLATSTPFLTLLLAVGLFFFIRASVKDRTTRVRLTSELPETELLLQIQTYFINRSYRVKSIAPGRERIVLEGYVRPSWFLAIFLTLLAACGCICLALVLSFTRPEVRDLFVGMTLLAPLAGTFYWQRAGRVEEVVLDLDASAAPDRLAIEITAHRDEIIQLRKSLPLTGTDS